MPMAGFAICVALVFAAAGHAALPVIVDHVSEHLLALETERFRRFAEEHGAVAPPELFSTSYLGVDSLPLSLRDRVGHLAEGRHELRKKGRELWVSRSSLKGIAEPLFVVLEFPKEPFAAWKGIIALGALGILAFGVALAIWTARRIARPLQTLAALVESTPPERLADAFGTCDLDQEVQVLVDRLATSLRAIDSHAAREQRFTRYASHELRTPVTVIHGALELLKETPEAQAPGVRRPLERIVRAAADMHSTIESFLWLARENSEGNVSPPVELVPLVRRVVDRYRHLLEGKPIVLRVEGSPNVTVAAPAGVIEIVVGNIVANAFHYTEHGEISIEIVPRGIIVADSGPGMDCGHSEGLDTSSFVQGDKSVGHGLGLSIVQSLCARFGWSIEMDSAVGTGTRATLSFT